MMTMTTTMIMVIVTKLLVGMKFFAHLEHSSVILMNVSQSFRFIISCLPIVEVVMIDDDDDDDDDDGYNDDDED